VKSKANCRDIDYSTSMNFERKIKQSKINGYGEQNQRVLRAESIDIESKINEL
jgi:hypothetical protein